MIFIRCRIVLLKWIRLTICRNWTRIWSYNCKSVTLIILMNILEHAGKSTDLYFLFVLFFWHVIKNNIVTVPHTEGILSSPRSWTHLRLFSFCPCIVCSFLLLNVTSLGLRNYLGWGLCFKAFLCVCPWFAVLYYSVGSYLVRLPQTTLK